MLSEVLQQRPIQFNIKADRCVRRTAAAIVNGRGAGKINPLPAGIAETLAPVDIFAVHEKRFIEWADGFQRASPGHPEPAVQHIHFFGPVIWKILGVVTLEETDARENGVEHQSIAEAIPRSGKSHGGTMNNSIRFEHARA